MRDRFCAVKGRGVIPVSQLSAAQLAEALEFCSQSPPVKHNDCDLETMIDRLRIELEVRAIDGSNS